MLSGLFFSLLERESLIASNDSWSLMAVLTLSVALAIYLEQRYAFASKISGAIIALIFALVLSNLSIIPQSSVLYDDIIWGYAVPMGIPLLLLNCNLKKIWKETGRLLILFLLGSLGTLLGAFIGYFLLRNYIPELNGIAAMMTGSYIGGGVNFAALAGQFSVSSEMVSSTVVADNLLMAIYFLVLIFMSGNKFLLSYFIHPHIDERKGSNTDSDTQQASYWKRKDISIKDIAINFAYCIIVVWISRGVSSLFSFILPPSSFFTTFFTSQYVWISTISMLVATYFEGFVNKLNGSQEIGTFLIYLFLFVIGVPASILQIIIHAPLLFVFTSIMVVCNMLFCLIGGKLLSFDLESVLLASNANIGGPTTAVGMAISQGWKNLIGPIMLVGTFGYVIGTYFGVIVGQILGA